MLRNKEPELAEKIDSSFGCFDLGFYRVNFVFGSRHLIIVPGVTTTHICGPRIFAPCKEPPTRVLTPPPTPIFTDKSMSSVRSVPFYLRAKEFVCDHYSKIIHRNGVRKTESAISRSVSTENRLRKAWNTRSRQSVATMVNSEYG